MRDTGRNFGYVTRMRWFLPQGSAFCSKDPVGVSIDGLNLYSAFGTDPLVMIDQNGLLKCDTINGVSKRECYATSPEQTKRCEKWTASIELDSYSHGDLGPPEKPCEFSLHLKARPGKDLLLWVKEEVKCCCQSSSDLNDMKPREFDVDLEIGSAVSTMKGTTATEFRAKRMVLDLPRKSLKVPCGGSCELTYYLFDKDGKTLVDGANNLYKYHAPKDNAEALMKVTRNLGCGIPAVFSNKMGTTHQALDGISNIGLE